MSTLELLLITDERLGPLTLQLQTGVNLVAAEPGALAALTEIASGYRLPQAGRVLLDNRSLRERSVRQRIYGLLPIERMVAARTVAEAWAAQNALRARTDDARTGLAAFGLGALAQARPERLSALELRAVAWAYACSDGTAAAYVFHEPLELTPLLAPSSIVARCRELARSAVVLIASSRLADAMHFGGSMSVVQDGRLARATPGGGHARFVVRCSDAERLAERLQRRGSLRVRQQPELAAGCLRVDGIGLNEVATAIVQSALEENIALERLEPIAPSLPNLLAAQRGIARLLAKISGARSGT